MTKKLQKPIALFIRHILGHKNLRYFTFNLLMGIIIFIALSLIQTTQFVEDLLNPMIDKLISNESEEAVQLYMECLRTTQKACDTIKKKITDHLIFFDIDSQTYLDWGEPALTPRDKLAELIDMAAQNDAKVIVVDILLYNQACHPDEDNKLIETLKKLSRKGIPIIFSVSLSQKRIIKKSQIHELDALIDKTPNFYRGLPLIMASKDGVVRYFSGYQVANDERGQQSVLWTLPVLAVTLYAGDIHALDALQNQILDKNPLLPISLTLKLNNNRPLFISSDNIYTNRLRFFMKPPDPYESEKPGNLSLMQRRTFDVLQHKEFHKGLKNKIVVIGNSSPSYRDIFMTPVGYMPGMYIIGNAINTMLHDRLQIIPPKNLNLFWVIPAIFFIAFVVSFVENFSEILFSLGLLCIIVAPFIVEFILEQMTIYVFAEHSVFLKMFLLMFVLSVVNQQIDIFKLLLNLFHNIWMAVK